MYKERIQINNQSVHIYSGNSSELLFIHNSNLELSSLDSLNQILETFAVSTLLVSLTIGTYFKSALYCYLYENYKTFESRPVNVLILAQAITQHLICLLMIAHLTIGLHFNVTFSEYFGEDWCSVLWYIQAYGAGFRNFGSLGIATFRLLLIKHNTWVKYKVGVVNLLRIVLVWTFISSALFAVGFGMGNGHVSRKQVAWNFCTGKSEQFREVEHNYSLLTNHVTSESEVLPKMALFASLASVVVELACYILFFRHLNLHDKGMLKKKVLTIGEVQKRRRQNAITFFGQFYGFCVEWLVYCGMIYTLKVDTDISYRLGLVLGYWIEFGLVSVVEITTSKCLKQYLPHNYFHI